MAPGIVSHKGPQSLPRVHITSGCLFFVEQVLSLEGRGHSPDERDTVHNSVEILIVPFFERVEIDRRGVTRVRRPKRDCTGSIAGVAFQYHPGEIVEVLREGSGVSRMIPFELGEQRHAEKIGRTFSDGRSPEDGEYAAVCGIHAAPAGVPLPVLWIISRKLRVLVDVPRRELHAVHDANLVAVLQIPSYTRQIHPQRDAEAFEYMARSDAGKHEELRRVECAAR